MKVWVFVEGESDKSALNALWTKWRADMGRQGWGIQIIPMDDKSHFFRKIGPRAAEKLANNDSDLVVGLPDLYPNVEYTNTAYAHENLAELKTVQKDLVKNSLSTVFGASEYRVVDLLARFYPTALKHDLEVLLLAATEELKKVLRTSETLGNWRHPVEDQNQTRSPKYVVADLFRTKRRESYRDTIHAKAVLEKVQDIRGLLYNRTGQLECPEFKATMDWIAGKTGVKGY